MKKIFLSVLLLAAAMAHAETPAAPWTGTGTALWGLDQATGLLRPITTKIDAAGNTGIVTFVAVDPNAGPLPVSVTASIPLTVTGAVLEGLSATAVSDAAITRAISVTAQSISATAVGIHTDLLSLSVTTVDNASIVRAISGTALSISTTVVGIHNDLLSISATTVSDAAIGRAISATAANINSNLSNVTVNTHSVITIPTTTGGLTTFHLVGAATTNATNIKASAGQVYGWHIWNNHASSPRKLVFHNTAGTPTAGASVFFTVVVPPQLASDAHYAEGVAFSTGIGITTVTGLADSDATAIAAQGLIIEIFYK